MNLKFVRPKISDLVFQLHAGPAHPELFRTYAEGLVRHEDRALIIKITDSSHVLCWGGKDRWLTEIAASARQPLPKHRRLLAYRLKGERTDQVGWRGVLYRMSFQVERVEPEIFLHLDDELSRDGEKHGLFYRFGTTNRLFPAPLSLVQVQSAAGSLLVQAFHTFPAECAIVKTQSLFETTVRPQATGERMRGSGGA